jgi:hypothetical protein
MSRDDRIALLLAARLLESDVPYDAPDLRGEGGHLDVAFDLAERLRRVSDGDTAGQIAASLRSAASEGTEA